MQGEVRGHALEAPSAGVAVACALLVSAWWTVEQPWETIIPWLEAPLDLERVRAAYPRIETSRTRDAAACLRVHYDVVTLA